MYGTLEQRRDARETVEHPGKFERESPMVPILWDLILDGGMDEDAGDATEGIGYAARVGRWIISLSTDGFVTGCRYRTLDEAEREFANIADGLNLDYSEGEDES